jgi:tRNA pseudouridine38-40 synthase
VIKKGERRANPFKEKRRFDMTGFDEGDKANLQEEADEEEEKVDKRALAEMEG